ncbi:NAD(P)/FAD-dependent oxidoreductase [Nocardia otitidiscaviarum]|uniref:NAD(P)/FAD-dependent oxidoreductase n=1 Tax=Nocardia otitidiscaviarum TaxID=1823 RepID=A0A516NQW8_9NOCA|nr:NAD(P)/FAD-dependent oxidoreductase [Nocardia otitidiscaviarum]MCP9620465.1 NAD(P)/FAD-dependent oxidoreductase [Nocardia otitidiscaviarum]QDP81302.1 NAD(P)/FAD-dependent oxidoreductase [Nocardia otitidiscaviarum]
MKRDSTTDSLLDVVVIGGGAAGLTAAQVLGRARRTVAVIDSHAPRNGPAALMHGFLSRDGTPPAALVAAGRQEALAYGVDLVDEHVTEISWRGVDPGFVLRLSDGRELETRAVLVSTGLRDELPDIPGLWQRWGIDVLHCPFCHGYEVHDEPIGVLGGEVRELSIHQALLLPQWSSDVVFFPNGIELTDGERARIRARGVEIVEGPVRGIVASDDRLRAVELDDGRLVPRAVLFVGPRFVPNDSLLTGIGCDVGPHGFVTVDGTGRTSVPGIWAAGNVADPRAQVITAAGAGSAAAIAINGYLLDSDVAAALAQRDRVPSDGNFSPAMEREVSAIVLRAKRSDPRSPLS